MIRKIIAASALGLLLGLPLNGYPQERNPQALKALEALKHKIGDGFRVEWSEDGSRVIGLETAEWSETQSKKVASLSLPEEISGTPEEIAIDFLQNNSELFQINKNLVDFQLENAQQHDEYTYYVHLQQTIDKLPVLNRGIGISIDMRDSRFTLKGVTSVISHYEPNTNISTTPMLSEQEAIAIAQKNAAQHPIRRRDKSGHLYTVSPTVREMRSLPAPKVTLAILVSNDEQPALIYRLRLKSIQYTIDANTGDIISVGDIAQYASGTGDVFWPNPVNSANNLYLEDKDDANAPELLPQYIRGKVLRDIKYDSASQTYVLCGPYICPNDLLSDPAYFITSPYPGSVFSSTENFASITNRFSDLFEHVMVYDVIDTNQRYIQTLGLGVINKRPIEVDPHALQGEDTSHYEPDGTGKGYILFGEGGVDDAEDADIILHEYGHAIQDNQAPNIYGGFDFACITEAGAMAEGFGDYWASSNTYAITVEHKFKTGTKSGEACYAEWDNVVKMPRNEANACRRRVDGTKHYPENIVHECHDDGEIWSAALWDIFNRLGNKLGDKKVVGKKAADQLILRSHAFIQAKFKDSEIKPKFSDGGLALLQADQILVKNGKFPSSNKNIICGALGKRGIAVKGPTAALTCPPAT